MKIKYSKTIALIVALQSQVSVSSLSYAVNNLELPLNQPGNFQLIGRYSTVNQGIPSINNSLNVEMGTVYNGKVYLSMAQSCITDTWPAGNIAGQPAGSPVKGGVLVLDVNDVHNISEAGRLPWSVSDPIANPLPQYIRTSTTGAPKVEKLGSRVILAVEWSGDNCLPRFPSSLTPGQNGIELWDVTNPDPAKAKRLSFIQIRDINPINAANEPRGVVPSYLKMYKKGNKSYLVVGASTKLGSLRFYDISNPEAPVLAASWGPEQIAFPGVDAASATASTSPSLKTLNDYMQTFNPTAYGFNVRGAFPYRIADHFDISKDGKRAYVASIDSGLVLLDINDLNNIKVISVAKDLTDAARSAGIGSTLPAVSENGKVVVERAGSSPTFLKFTLANDPGYFVDVAEAAFSPKIATIGGVLSTNNNLVYVGDACETPTSVLPSGGGNKVALMIRGTCSFAVKAANVQNKGYIGAIVINSVGSGNTSISQGGLPPTTITIPDVAIPYYAGLKLLDPALIPPGYTVPDPFETTYAPGLPALPTCRNPADPLYGLCFNLAATNASVNSGFIKASGMRIWDYSNEKNPKLVSTLDTHCSNNPSDTQCLVAGVTFGVSEPKLFSNKYLYLPWSADGLIKVDLTKINTPVLLGNFKDLSPSFISQNGGPASYTTLEYDKATGCVYTASNVGGLYVFDDPTDDKICGSN